MKALLGTGVLAVWNDIAEENESEYNDWYTNQHLPERVGIEGFLRGRRFHRTSDDPGQKYFTLYEVESTATLTSEPYMERLNDPTDWTKRVTPLFLNGTRTACSVTTSVGRGTGGYATTIEFGAAADREGELRSWLVDDVLPKLVTAPDIVAAHLCEADLETTSAKDSTAEQAAMKDRPTVTVRWFVLVESASEAGAAVARDALSGAALQQHGAEGDVKVGTFALLAALDH
jgi:hypothetical protein